MIRNVEIKARSRQNAWIRAELLRRGARQVGLDHQIDTYFHVASGRLKWREGKIENHLIHYQRGDQAGPKLSEVLLYKIRPDEELKSILTRALGIWVVVDKRREIFFLDNVKFHLDEVKGLGSFFEIEAIDEHGTSTQQDLQQQCDHYLSLFKIDPEQLVAESYSDLLSKAAPWMATRGGVSEP